MSHVSRSGGLKALSGRELRRLLQAVNAPLPRAAAAMMAFTGFSHFSLNRITFRDGLPELRIERRGGRTSLKVLRVPMVVATPMAAWAPGSPFYRQGPFGQGWRWSFLSKDGCNYLLAYLRTRLQAKGSNSLAPSHRLFVPSEPFFYGYFRRNVSEAAERIGLGRWSLLGCERLLRQYFTQGMKSVGACERCIEFMGETQGRWAYAPYAPSCNHSPEDMRQAYSVAAIYALPTGRKTKRKMTILKEAPITSL
jgi:hypothetical protein